MDIKTKRFYEVGGALLKADSPEDALELYKQCIGYDAKIRDVREVRIDYALCAFSKGLDVDGKPARVSKTLAEFYKHESEIMLYPTDII
ncbi:hypothetical protein MOE86_04615 [Bacillus atrophaeus]|uniref:hypothetical protein n=1 Tax=Bacillus atrophaeus TaxID=1452 RepID=UPI0022804356|nr:hypothetical protein [Bacillus atrophaeus]MCY9196006.1 hypothetical protein [Bacillus atrophaeus]